MTSTGTLQIRSAIPSDYDGFAKLWPTLNDMNPAPLQQRWEKEMMPTSLVAEHHGTNNSGTNNIAGYVWWTATAGSFTAPEGQIKYIMVDTSCRRQGVATAMLQAVAKKFKEEYKCRRWRLNVRPENQPAVSLYRKFGLERMFGSAEVHIKWSCLSKLAWSSKAAAAAGKADCLPVGSPEEEAAIESAFALPPGVFGEAREFGGRIPLQLRSTTSKNTTSTATESDDGQLLLGCCIFDPAFPGAYPFCVTRPHFAKPLLEEMEKHRDRARDDFFLLVENQETLVEALVAAGAKVEIDLDCYSGSLR